ncbi:MAG: GDP-L-fucose synthase [Candidatus Babeliales bacterium]
MKQVYIFAMLLSAVTTALIASEMPRNARIYVAGHHGLVGSALVEALTERGYTTLITRSSQELDLRNQEAVNRFFAQEKIEYVFLAAARVGGIKANDLYPASFIYDNLMIEANIMHAAYTHGVTKLLFLGSSCIYPRECPQPIREEYLLSGPLEKTNDAYALAKIAGLRLCQAYKQQYGTRFISCMPTNLYGYRDNFHPQNSHVIPGLMYKIDQAKKTHAPSITLWGTGGARREFLFVEDLADALIYLMNHYEDSLPINVGTGTDGTIYELANMLKNIIGYEGDILFDGNRYYDGTPQKLLCVDRLQSIGWQASTPLEQGLTQTYDWYTRNMCALS